MEMATNYMMLEQLVLGGLEGMDSSPGQDKTPLAQPEKRIKLYPNDNTFATAGLGREQWQEEAMVNTPREMPMEQENSVKDQNEYADEVFKVQNNDFVGACSLPGLTGEGMTWQVGEQVDSMEDQVEVGQEENKFPTKELGVVEQHSLSEIPNAIRKIKRKRNVEDDDHVNQATLMNREQMETEGKMTNKVKPSLRKVLVAGRGRGKPKKGNCMSLSRIENFLVKKPLGVGKQQNKSSGEQVDHMEKDKLATKCVRLE